MVSIPTTLVLGAGASYSYGMPLGAGLLKDVQHRASQIWLYRKQVDKYPDVSLMLQALQEFGTKIESVNDLANAIRDSHHESIDALLEHRDDLREVGKLFIARSLLPAEMNRNTDGVIQQHADDRWYSYLLRAMSAPQKKWLDNQIKIITYNYDRTLELSFCEHLKETYNLSHGQAQSMVDGLPIYHLHGKMGSPWGGSKVPMSKHFSSSDLVKAASDIQLVHESGRYGVREELINNMLGAEQVVFLGFAFHPMSCKLLHEAIGVACSSSNVEIYASGYKLLQAERETVQSAVNPNIKWGGMNMRNLEFIRSLVRLV